MRFWLSVRFGGSVRSVEIQDKIKAPGHTLICRTIICCFFQTSSDRDGHNLSQCLVSLAFTVTKQEIDAGMQMHSRAQGTSMVSDHLHTNTLTFAPNHTSSTADPHNTFVLRLRTSWAGNSIHRFPHPQLLMITAEPGSQASRICTSTLHPYA